MKTTKLFLTIILLFALKTTMSQETWYVHYVGYYPYPYMPNLNSITINKSLYEGVVCADSGYIAGIAIPIYDWWLPNYNLITNNNLYGVYDVDSSYITKAYIVGENGTILKTNDIIYAGNIPFYNQNSPTINDLYSVYFTNYFSGVAVGDTGTIVKTTDGGSHWNLISSITLNKLYSVQFPSVNIGYAAGVNGTVIKTTNGGGNWVMKTQAIADTLRCIWFTDDNTGFVVSRNGAIYKTTDGGNNWQSKPSGTTQNLNAIRFYSTSIGYAGGNNNTILKTTNEGENWTIQTLPPIPNLGNYKSISISLAGEVALVGSNGNAIANYPEPGYINNYMKDGDVVITPNPAKDYININTGLYDKLILQIYNTQGQRVCEQKLTQGLSQISISNYMSGLYLYQVTDDKGKVIGKGKWVKGKK